tara:strand:+ start:9665 stop:9910 length:246 start_codon:yes stop_codon:yes gene_type:complete
MEYQMNFIFKFIIVALIAFVGVAYVASQQNKNTVGEVTLDDVGKTASEGANKIRRYLVNDAKEDSQRAFEKTKEKIEEVTE